MKISKKQLLICLFFIGLGMNCSISKCYAGPVPTITEFNAQPARIMAGESSLLTWSTRKADICKLDPGDISVPCSGSRTVLPDETTTYHLTAGNTRTQESAAVTVSVTQLNHPPAAVDDSVTTDEDQSATVNLLANDTDADGDPLTIEITSQTVNGTLIDNGNGSVTYTPNEDFNGPDSFIYTVNDGNGGTDTGLASILVNPINDPPVVQNSSVMTGMNTPVDIALAASDIDNDQLSYSIIGNPMNGTVSRDDGDNLITYTPLQDFSGYETIAFTAHDGTVESNIGTITIAIGINLPPTADSQDIQIAENMTVSITLTGSDPNLDPLTYNILSAPVNGQLSGIPPDLTYLPNQDFQGTDSFSFVVNDGQLTSNLATVSVTVTPVNHPPEARNDLAPTIGSPPITTGNVLANDTDADNDILTIVSFTQPEHGTVINNGDNTFTYSPDYLYNGLDSFNYTITDGQGETATARVLLTVNNPPPTVIISSSPGKIAEGETALLTWDTAYATTVSMDNGIGEVPASGTLEVSPAESTSYTINVSGFGGSASAGTSVDVWSGKGQPSPTVSISASPETVLLNDPATLTWSSSKADVLSIDNGIGPVEPAGALEVFPGKETTYTITGVDRKGNSATASVTVKVTPMDIEVYSPVDGDVVAGTDVLVQGVFTNLQGSETGIMVNNRCALSDGSEFAANHVMLSEGNNTISVAAIDSSGNSLQESIAVSEARGDYLALEVDSESGVVPFETTLSIKGNFDFAGEPVISYDGPGVADIQPGAEGNIYNIQISTPGLYYFSAEAANDMGEIFTDRVAVLTLDQVELDSRLRDKWSGMKESLAARNVDGALEFFVDSSKERYRTMFTLLHDDLPQVANNMQQIEMGYIKGGRAKYRINNVIKVDGSPVTITSDIYFVRDRDCIWKIQQF